MKIPDIRVTQSSSNHREAADSATGPGDSLTASDHKVKREQRSTQSSCHHGKLSGVEGEDAGDGAAPGRKSIGNFSISFETSSQILTQCRQEVVEPRVFLCQQDCAPANADPVNKPCQLCCAIPHRATRGFKTRAVNAACQLGKWLCVCV